MRNSRIRDYLDVTEKLYEASSNLCVSLMTLFDGADMFAPSESNRQEISTLLHITVKSLEVTDAIKERLPKIHTTIGAEQDRLARIRGQSGDGSSSGAYHSELHATALGRSGEPLVETGLNPTTDVFGP